MMSLSVTSFFFTFTEGDNDSGVDESTQGNVSRIINIIGL